MKLILIPCLLTVAYGLKVIPTPKDGVISYSSNDESSSLEFRQELEAFWLSYFKGLVHDDSRVSTIINCEQGEAPPKLSDKFCSIDYHGLGACNPETGFLYNSSKSGPCVYLQSRKIPNWEPEYYNVSTIPKNIPKYLQNHIKEIEETHGADSKKLKVTWVSCEVENEEDLENIGPISYYPKSGFDGQYFPIRNEKDYFIPFIAVHFENPKRGVSVKVQCKAWALNLPDETIKFEIFVNQ